jgi:predicted ATPase
MKESIKPVFSSTPLDPHLLATPFEVQTNWHVITGAPSCGKSTLIDLLAARGFRTIPEAAREYMQAEIDGGRTIDEIRADVVDLQRVLFRLQLEVECGLPAGEVIFLDVALPGSLGWYRLFGLDPNEILPACFRHRYASVFMLEPLPIRLDDLRFDDEAITRFLDEWQLRDYRALGYRVVRVPVLSPEERLAWVLDRLSEGGWI